jgi:rare lipoprotein A
MEQCLTRRIALGLSAATLSLLLASCSSVSLFEESDSRPDQKPDLDQISEPVPRAQPRSKYGNPDSYVVFGKRYHVMPTSDGYRERGIASWYGTKFHGRKTSSGEPYDMYQFTAAHKTLPLPTYARVTNLKNGRSIIVKINDRGPFHDNRLIDLSYAAAYKLGISAAGTGLVEVAAINPAAPQPRTIQAAAPAEPAAVARADGDRQVIPAVELAGDRPVGMYVQVGAYSDRSNAERMRLRLAQADITDIRLSRIDSEDNSVYRVRIGPLTNVERADELTSVLQALGVQDPRVIID